MFCSCYDHQTEEKPNVLVRFVAHRDPSQVGVCFCPVWPTASLFEAVNNLAVTGSNQAYRAISTSQLNALLRLHLWPIDVVVFHGPQGYLVLRGASRLDAFSGYPVRS